MLILGHRGARAVAPENTLPAFHACLLAGAAGTELDVRLTSDDVALCVHDATLYVAGRQVRVCDAPAADFEGVLVEGPRGTRERPATLAAALAVLQGALVVVEVKNHPWDVCYDAGYRVAGVLAGLLPEGAIVACFDPETLAAIRRLRPELTTAVITAAGFDAASNLETALAGGHGICSVEHLALTPAFVERAHEAGRDVYAWTTDEPERVRELASMGVDALMCDDPARALAALGRMGA